MGAKNRIISHVEEPSRYIIYTRVANYDGDETMTK